jgi:pseudaminic acid synthase
MVDMKERFGVEIGLSDHTLGNIVPFVATSLGAKVIEKHFILDRALGGPDSDFSMEPSEFKYMVEEVRNVEKTLGKVTYEVNEKDKLRRRSLFAVQDIKKGEVITEENVRSIRPGHGLHPKYYDSVLGKTILKDIERGMPLSIDFIE